MSVTDDIRASRLLTGLRDKLATAKRASENSAAAETYRKEVHKDALVDLEELDGRNGSGVRFQHEDRELAAFVCQPEDELIWDAAALTEHLKKIGKYDAVCVTVIDPEKLESEMAAGNIKRASLKKFQIAKPRAAYLKFINPKPESK
jgi:hypothetical protein